MPTTIRIGLVGAGHVSKRHLAAIAQVPFAELVGMADTNPAAEETARGVRVPFHVTADALIETGKLDAVIVATPTVHHCEPVCRALDAGLPVLVEKPICATLEETQDIINRCEAGAPPVLVGHQRRYWPQVERARNIVQSGKLGRLVAINGQWTLRKHEDYYTPDWRKEWKAGPVLTNLIHDIDSIRTICGEIESVSAETSNHVRGWEKEDVAAIILRFENGALGTFLLSDQATSPWSWESATGENDLVPDVGENALRIMGTKASLEFPNLKMWWQNGATHDWTRPFTSEDISNDATDPYVEQLKHFCEVIRGEASPRVDAIDAARSLAVTLAVLKSADADGACSRVPVGV